MQIQSVNIGANPKFEAKISHRKFPGVGYGAPEDLNLVNQFKSMYDYERKCYAEKAWHNKEYFGLDIIEKFEKSLNNIPDKSEYAIIKMPYINTFSIILKDGEPVAGLISNTSLKEHLDIFCQYLTEEYPHELIDMAIKNNFMQRMFQFYSEHKHWEECNRKIFQEQYSDKWERYDNEYQIYSSPLKKLLVGS